MTSTFRRLAVVVGLVGALAAGACLWVRPSPVAMPVVPDGGYGFSVGAPQSWLSAHPAANPPTTLTANWMPSPEPGRSGCGC